MDTCSASDLEVFWDLSLIMALEAKIEDWGSTLRKINAKQPMLQGKSVRILFRAVYFYLYIYLFIYLL